MRGPCAERGGILLGRVLQPPSPATFGRLPWKLPALCRVNALDRTFPPCTGHILANKDLRCRV